MDNPLDENHLYRLMVEAADQVGYLSGESCKVLIALALRPESRASMLSLKNGGLYRRQHGLHSSCERSRKSEFREFDGKGGILINEALLEKPYKPNV